MRKTVLLFLLSVSVYFLKAQPFSLLKNVNASAATGASSPFQLVGFNGILFFVASTPTYGHELWKSDGTVGGTVLVKDIVTGSSSSNPQYVTAVGTTLYFSANDGVKGDEVWKSDGTEAGTVLVQDIAPGSGGSNPQDFVYVNGKLFFVAQTEEFGRELYVSNTAVVLPLTLLEFSARLRNNDGLVSWKTAREENIASFEVERSLNGGSFKKWVRWLPAALSIPSLIKTLHPLGLQWFTTVLKLRKTTASVNIPK